MTLVWSHVDINQRKQEPDRPHWRSSSLPVAHSCARLHSRNAALRSVIVGVQRACRGHSVRNNWATQPRFQLQRQVPQPSSTKGRAVAGRNASCTPLRPADRSRDPTGCSRVFFPRSGFLSFELTVFTCCALLIKEKYEL